MIWSIDMELDELVADSKSSEGTSGNQHQRNGEKDKHVVADLVKKLLVCEIFHRLACDTERLSCRLPELFNLALAESGSIVVWSLPRASVSTNHTGTSVRSGRGRVFCWFDSTLPVCPH
jgi:hypothetical protein